MTQSAKSRFKVSVIVVVADKEKLQRSLRLVQLLGNLWIKRTVVGNERILVKPMMDGRDRPSRPALQFAGKSLTWRDRNLRPLKPQIRS